MTRLLCQQQMQGEELENSRAAKEVREREVGYIEGIKG